MEAKPVKTLAVISKEGKYLVGKKRLAKSGTKKSYDKVLAFDIVPKPVAQNVNPNVPLVNNFVQAPAEPEEKKSMIPVTDLQKKLEATRAAEANRLLLE